VKGAIAEELGGQPREVLWILTFIFEQGNPRFIPILLT
jgi:hypothetical protein